MKQNGELCLEAAPSRLLENVGFAFFHCRPPDRISQSGGRKQERKGRMGISLLVFALLESDPLRWRGSVRTTRVVVGRWSRWSVVVVRGW